MLVLDVVVVARVRLGPLAVNERALKAANEADLKGDGDGDGEGEEDDEPCQQRER